ncbi:GAF domain-containing protein [Planctomycetota bacterium]
MGEEGRSKNHVRQEAERLRQEAEDALRLSQERYQLATQAAKVGVWDWNVKTGDFYLDPAIKARLGYRDDEIPNDLERWVSYVHPDDRQAVMDAAQEHMDGKTPSYVFEHRMLHKDGSVRWILVRGQAIRDEHGAVVRMVGTDTDITEPKLAEREESTRNRILQAFLAESDQDMYDAVLKTVLSAFESEFGVFGYLDEQGSLVCPSMTTHVWDQCRMPDKTIVFPRDTWGESIWGKGLRTGQSAYSNEPFHVPQGHVPIENCLTAPLVLGGKSIGLLTVSNKQDGYDETDRQSLETTARNVAPVLRARLARQRAEVTVERERRAFAIIAEAAVHAADVQDACRRVLAGLLEVLCFDFGTVRLLDPEARVLRPTAAVGLTEEEEREKLPPQSLEDHRYVAALVGRTRSPIFAPDVRGHEILQSHAARLSELGVRAIISWPILGSAQQLLGVMHLVARTPRAIAMEDRSFFETVAKMFSAVLERKRGEEERQKLQAEILRIQKLESLGVLAGGIAHDLNNALTGIVCGINAAQCDLDPGSDGWEMLAEAEKAALQARSLSQQLLTFAKGGTPVRKSTSISGLLRDTVSFALSGSSARSELEIPAHVWAVEVDEGQIRQVVSNIAVNADEAMAGGGIVRVSVENVHVEDGSPLPISGGRYVRVSIGDQGVGIPEEHLLKVFDPYFTTKQRGSGFGLATSYSIVQKHAGHIAMTSELGQGTTVHLYLPASEEQPEPRAPRAGLASGDKARILLMDDEEIVLKTVAGMLRRHGHEVESARNGSEAVRMYREALAEPGPFSLVILDLTVPGGMGGREAVKQLRLLDPEVRAIVASGYSEDPVLANYEEHGFCGALRKPFETEELLVAMTRATACASPPNARQDPT